MTMYVTPGTVFAGYLIERRIGSGGMGAVYAARHPRLPRLVALKILTAEAGGTSRMRARFEREADLIAQLDHPNVVDIYDRGTEGDHLWITMRLVDGLDVARLVAPGHPMRPAARAVGIVAQAADGLDAAHRRRLLHRDVKPANLLVATADDGSDQVFVTDFGIARSIESPRLTSTGSIVATLAYASPEQIGAGPIDHRTDVYSLGATLFEMLIGEAPFAGRPPPAVLTAHLNEPPPLPSRIDPSLPVGLDEVIATAMAKDPNRRFDSCAALAAAAWRALEPAAAWGGPEPAAAWGGPEAAEAWRGPETAEAWRGPETAGAAPILPPTAAALPGTRIADGSGPRPSVPSRSGRRSRGLPLAAVAVALALVGVIVTLLIVGPQRGDGTETLATTGTLDPTTGTGSTSAGSASTTETGTGHTPTSEAPTTETAAAGTASTTPSAGASVPTGSPYPAWGAAGELVAMFPYLLPATPDDVGYQNSRCESIEVLNNGRMPALQCTGDGGLLWYVWSFRPDDPRWEQTSTAAFEGATAVDEPWQRVSGSGTLRMSDGPDNSGALVISFDDPNRRWILIDITSWYYDGRGLTDLWWADAPI
ncbi:serine/threonine-protein kinase [Millisia brevis]|uniref:serine/threonine-protein kinase n=1 Tax=Millisia brevis TaxID=264148 RepID=UPI000832205D|nr:serine/threonine-protein kinase [Millisia brevis]